MVRWHSESLHFFLHPVRQVIYDRSTPFKSIHYQSLRSRTKPSQISSLNHAPEVSLPPQTRTYSLSIFGPAVKMEQWKFDRLDIQPFAPHHTYSDRFLTLTIGLGVEQS
ncbi:hypothetical protein AVEN_226848-1 [Araneus ventricosus]|uniref:Uncharacterized protein n=1 Tax=Araneus ventricosus TaxID=182803 RepID=A0A4Y2EYS7_ARAVE|nr:hypothetical protein AVEN_226848-1 [Araneus ventricosus]